MGNRATDEVAENLIYSIVLDLQKVPSYLIMDDSLARGVARDTVDRASVLIAQVNKLLS